ADQTVTGSPCGTNIFKVEGPGLPVGGVQTDLFSNVVGRRADICGNGFVDLNEQCDLGAANGQPGSCCNADCTFASATTACDDGSACTTADTCAGGSCVGGPPPVCNDANSCTADGCDPATGCTHTTLADLTACEDGNLCTQSGACLGGACIGSNPIICTAQDQCHVAGVCDPASGVCSNPAASDG